ncbi:unnamed protein product [Symbiodinium microadriaticum]|nr:unnamed protein product [Symbiodinium microadriaticum]
MGLNNSRGPGQKRHRKRKRQRNDKAALALIDPVKDVKPKYPPGGHAYVWGVTWPGHSDKWGNEEAPYVDWEEVGKAFKVWKDLGMGAPLEYLQGTFAILSEVASSKLPAKGGLHLKELPTCPACHTSAPGHRGH